MNSTEKCGASKNAQMDVTLGEKDDELVQLVKTMRMKHVDELKVRDQEIGELKGEVEQLKRKNHETTEELEKIKVLLCDKRALD